MESSTKMGRLHQKTATPLPDILGSSSIRLVRKGIAQHLFSCGCKAVHWSCTPVRTVRASARSHAALEGPGWRAFPPAGPRPPALSSPLHPMRGHYTARIVLVPPHRQPMGCRDISGSQTARDGTISTALHGIVPRQPFVVL